MKVLIDIPEEEYERFKKNQKKEYSESMLDVNIIANGIPIPDNATNGQVIRTLFKSNRVERTDDDVIVENYDFSKKWWNSPYQKGGKEWMIMTMVLCGVDFLCLGLSMMIFVV